MSTGDEASRLSHAIAIVGMAGRFPGGHDVTSFWRAICAGENLITRFDPAAIEDSLSADERQDPCYVPARSVLPDVDQFDAGFFGMKPREAEFTDPQQRMFLELCWEAFENASILPSANPKVGVFAGASLNTYFMRHVLQDRETVDDFTSRFQIGRYSELLGGLTDMLALRVSYKLGLTGPSLSVNTACSTSLTAIALACQSLQLYQCDAALAGGVSITFPQARGYQYAEGGIGSPDGLCRPYDAASAGTVFGHGAGVVLLKRYEDAVRDGDLVYGVITGYGINNDGSEKAGITAPSVAGQAGAMAAAYAMADIDPATIGYVEGHGTATPLGDPIEIAALNSVLGSATDDALPCHLGSVKGNVGHLDAAAGVTGLIKATLTLHHRQIPPLAHFTAPNPRLDLAGSRLVFDTALTPWLDQGVPRRAAVNALGVGGTNVHIVIEETPRSASGITEVAIAARAVVLPVSAKSPTALAATARQLATALEAPGAPGLLDVACTLFSGRTPFKHRLAVAGSTHAEAADALRDAAAKLAATTKTDTKTSPPAQRLAFMFPGQGTQYPGMARLLYETNPAFRSDVDTGFRLASRILGIDLKARLYPEPGPAADGESIFSTVLAQPALFIIEHALARDALRLGAKPTALIGHSLGEFVAATIAGVFTFEQGLDVVAHRAKLMVELPTGSMLSVRLPLEQLTARLPRGLDIASVNSRQSTVVAGPTADIEQFAKQLAGDGVACRKLHTSHAFHSRMMDPALEPLRALLSKIPLRPPTIPIASAVTGDWLSDADATSPDYWANHSRATVRFSDAITRLVGDGAITLAEMGPGVTLATLARQSAGGIPGVEAVATLPEFDQQDTSDLVLARAHAAMLSAGQELDASKLASGGRRTPLPTYPFQRSRHFIDLRPATRALPAAALSRPQIEQTTMATTTNIAANTSQSDTAQAARTAHRDSLAAAVMDIFADVSGESFDPAHRGANFLELGYDSLLLGQIAQRVNRTYKTAVTFRQLMSSCPNVDTLAGLLAEKVPPAAAPTVPAPAAEAAPTLAQPSAPQSLPPPTIAPAAAQPAPAQLAPVAAVSYDATSRPVSAGSIDGLFRDQLAVLQTVMANQIAALTQAPHAQAAPAHIAIAVAAPAPQAQPVLLTAPPAPTPAVAAPNANTPAKTSEPPKTEATRFDTFVVSGSRSSQALTDTQQRFIQDLSRNLERKMPGSKAFTQRHRARLADPRAAASFDSRWKELVYPVVAKGASGAYIHDIDDNTYVDVVNGFGPTAFGHNPPFVIKALEEQLRLGFPIGPQADVAGDVVELLCDMTGNERATFCNTGSEAVMAAMRVARAVTGRNQIVMFTGAYHGQFDEVLAKPGRQHVLPAALGIPAGSLGNVVILPYGEPQSLDWIKANSETIAAVIAEPVQSRRPAFRPREFLAEVRRLTEISGAALVFDEIVTGFRVALGGMQEVYGIRADMATYGKVLGGGMPIGVLAGNARFMDALDGGQWRFGDDSVPEIPPTFLAGTFVRHPLTLSAARAVLLHLKSEGQPYLDGLNARTEALAKRLNADVDARGLTNRFEHFASWFYITPAKGIPLASLFFPHMRLQGIHVQEGFPWFMTTAHSAADFDAIANAAATTFDALQDAGILDGQRPKASASSPTPPAATPTRAINGTGAPLPAAMVATPSPSMREVYMIAQLGSRASTAFNEGLSLRLGGNLDAKALSTACQTVVDRHAILRSNLGATGETLTIPARTALDIPLVDLSGSSDRAAALQALIHQDQTQPFDLETGPLIRFQIAKLDTDDHALLVCGHHIAFDGWSAGLITAELAELYTAARKGTPAALAEPSPVAALLQTHDDKNAASATYWLERFKSPPAPLELPTDRPRAAIKTFRGRTTYGHLPRDLQESIRNFSKAAGVTPFVTLLAGLKVVLARLSGQTDICVLVPMAGHQLHEREGLVGHLINFLPIRVDIARDLTVKDQVSRVRDALFEAYEHQDYTLGQIVEKLDPPRGFARTPYSDVQFNLEREIADPGFDALRCQVRASPKTAVNLDTFFNLVDTADGIRLEVDYNTDLYDEATIRGWITCLRTALEAMTKTTAAAQTVGRVPLLAGNEIKALLAGPQSAAPTSADTRSLHDLIAETAARRGDAIAVRHRDRTLTYRDLMSSTKTLARLLNEAIGEPTSSTGGRRIAIAVERSADLIPLLLAVWEAGDAFVPLDPGHPIERLAETMKAGAIDAIVASDPRIIEAAPSGAVRIQATDLLAKLARTNHAADTAAGPSRHTTNALDRPAYVIFTSGSTGVPKGVEIGHRALVNFMQSMAVEPGLSERDTLLAVTTICFDIAMLELFGPLLAGGQVVVADRSVVIDGFALADLVASSGANIMQATPSLWRMLVETDIKPNPALRMLVGGEPLPRDLAGELLKLGRELWNMYGPTETTIWSSIDRISADDLATTGVAIGRPIANTQFLVVDSEGMPQPAGVAGELLIGGTGLANGYFGRPDLTDKAFRDHTLWDRHPQQRFYSTGDLAVRLADGRYRHLGRRDQQIKLRGFRIELEDIETKVRSDASVAAAAVAVVGSPGAERLAAFIVARPGQTLSIGDIAAHVKRQLPDYMVPSDWQIVDALPLTGNGKLDRKQLPAMLAAPVALPQKAAKPEPVRVTQPRAAEPGLEQRIAHAIGEVLGSAPPSVDDNLMELGIDSLRMFRIVARLRRDGIAVSAIQLFEHPSVARLTAALAVSGRASKTETDTATAAVPQLSSYRDGQRRSRGVV